MALTDRRRGAGGGGPAGAATSVLTKGSADPVVRVDASGAIAIAPDGDFSNPAFAISSSGASPWPSRATSRWGALPPRTKPTDDEILPVSLQPAERIAGGQPQRTEPTTGRAARLTGLVVDPQRGRSGRHSRQHRSGQPVLHLAEQGLHELNTQLFSIGGAASPPICSMRIRRTTMPPPTSAS